MLLIFVQAAVSFVILLILTRLIGKQQVSQLTYYEYINGITFGSIAANMATDSFDKFGDHLVGLLTYGALTFMAALVALKSRKMRKLINGEPVVVIQDGKILENNLRKMKLNLDEFTMLLRLKDIFDFTQVKLAIIEPSGGLSVIKKSEYENVERRDLKLKLEGTALAVEVVQEGKISVNNLNRLGLEEKWLRAQLKMRQIVDVAEVEYAVVTDNKRLLVDLKNDAITDTVTLIDKL